MFVSAEVRWFWQDECPGNIRQWFDDVHPTERIDKYLWQGNQSEISIKSRGETSGFEIKGLIANLRSEGDFPVPRVELWCKWCIETPELAMVDTVTLRKKRWLRTFDLSAGTVTEIHLGSDKKPFNDRALPQHICNAEVTEIEIAGVARRWWTVGFEASSNLDSAFSVLRRTTAFLASRSFPFPSSGELLSYPSWLARLEPPIMR
jgi:hypothetical protein